MEGTRICYACNMGNYVPMHQWNIAFPHINDSFVSSELFSNVHSEFQRQQLTRVYRRYSFRAFHSDIFSNNQYRIRRSVNPSLRLGSENTSTRPRRSQPLHHGARIIASLSLHTAGPDFGDPIPAWAVFVTFITWDRQAHEPRHPCRGLPAFPQRGLDVVRRGVVFRVVIRAVLGELGQEVDT